MAQKCDSYVSRDRKRRMSPKRLPFLHGHMRNDYFPARSAAGCREKRGDHARALSLNLPHGPLRAPSVPRVPGRDAGDSGRDDRIEGPKSERPREPSSLHRNPCALPAGEVASADRASAKSLEQVLPLCPVWKLGNTQFKLQFLIYKKR